MKKAFSFYVLLLFLAAAMFSCGDDYDDSGIKKDISDLQSRVEKLETWCTTANSQITALQGLVEALQANDYITGVTPIMDGTTETGYTITFKKGTPITIMNGKDGVNGKDGINGTTPIIGVAKADDGLYYWTVKTGEAEATWLTDADGNKIRTTGDKGADGTIGKDGVAPKLSIEKDGDTYYWKVNDEWLLAADGNKVPATGAKGDTGAAGPSGSDGAAGAKGDSFFKSVTSYPDKGYVEFEPAVGDKFQVPLLSTTVSFDKYEPMQIATAGQGADVVVTLPLTLKKADFAAIKADITNVAGTNSAITRTLPAPEKWTVVLTAPTFENGILKDQPKVEVTVPITAIDGETALLKITVVDSDGNESTSTRVLYYSNKVAVTSVTIAPTTLTVNIGKTGALTATVAPANASNPKVNWTTSDATIATVATDGTVTGVLAGTATITATTEDGNFTATCAVTVENIAVTGITLADATVSIGGKKTLTATIAPADATIQTVTWSSSDTGVATITSTGEVEGVAEGETTITATTTDGSGVTGTCTVKVTKEETIEWATGNLVANADNSGCKIGLPTDNGLYFQFGSLVGWSTTGAPTIVVKPEDCTVTTWNANWKGDTEIENAKDGTGDPCRYYLKDKWRLPTKNEYATLFNNITDGKYANSGGWSWNETDQRATNSEKNLTLPAANFRSESNGTLLKVGSGYYWSASSRNANLGYSLCFFNASIDLNNDVTRSNGYSVRCVKDK